MRGEGCIALDALPPPQARRGGGVISESCPLRPPGLRRKSYRTEMPFGYRDPYHVYLGEVTTCSCADSRRAREAGEYCKHVHAAAIVAAKRRAARRREAGLRSVE